MEKTTESLALGKRLKEGRIKTGLNQAEFAEKLGCNRDTISRAEVGTQTPTEKLLRKITEVYDIDFVWLLTGETSSRDKDAYDKLNNQYEKQKQVIVEQKATISALKDTIAILATQLKGSDERSDRNTEEEN